MITRSFIMRLKLTQVESLARHIVKQLVSQKLAALARPPDEIANQIADIFRKNMEEENQINEEARRLLEQNKRKVGLTIDEERAFIMIKKQLAKQRNFVL